MLVFFLLLKILTLLYASSFNIVKDRTLEQDMSPMAIPIDESEGPGIKTEQMLPGSKCMCRPAHSYVRACLHNITALGNGIAHTIRIHMKLPLQWVYLRLYHTDYLVTCMH